MRSGLEFMPASLLSAEENFKERERLLKLIALHDQLNEGERANKHKNCLRAAAEAGCRARLRELGGHTEATPADAATLLGSGWKVALCACCWLPPWPQDSDDPPWDTDEALVEEASRKA